MSHRLNKPLTARSDGDDPLLQKSEIVRRSHEIEPLTAEYEGGLLCESRVCDVRFAKTGKPKRFCSDQCRMDAWAIRRVGELLKDLSDEKALAILRGQRELL